MGAGIWLARGADARPLVSFRPYARGAMDRRSNCLSAYPSETHSTAHLWTSPFLPPYDLLRGPWRRSIGFALPRINEGCSTSGLVYRGASGWRPEHTPAVYAKASTAFESHSLRHSLCVQHVKSVLLPARPEQTLQTHTFGQDLAFAPSDCSRRGVRSGLFEC